MRKIILNAFFVLGVLPVLNAQSWTPWIIGGSQATQQQFPWVGDILLNNSHQCGSALIRPNWVITAAHCLLDPMTELPVNISNVKLRFNSISTNGPLYTPHGVERAVKKIYMHPRFDINRFEAGYDIGLIELTSPVTSIRPINLPGIADTIRLYATNKKVFIAGWGATDSSASSAQPDTLKWCSTKIYDKVLCGQIFANQFRSPITTDRFCAGPGTGDTLAGAASGDSGGPIWLKNGTIDTIIGVVSGGFGTTTEINRPGLFTKVAFYRPWIDSIINSNTTNVKTFDWGDDQIKVGATGDAINVYFKNIGAAKISISLCNLNGQNVYQTEVLNPSFQSYIINTGNLIPGMYMLRIYDVEAGKQYTKKMLKSSQ